MRTTKPKIDYADMSRLKPHKLIDLSIESVQERMAKAVVFDNAITIAAYLGVSHKVVFNNRVAPKRVTGINGKQYAIRLV